MELEEKKELIRQSLPEMIAARMISQVRMENVGPDGNPYRLYFHRDSKPAQLIQNFCSWVDTVEKAAFWNALYELYEAADLPDNDQIIQIFNNHQISF